jgi:hypothetical protein
MVQMNHHCFVKNESFRISIVKAARFVPEPCDSMLVESLVVFLAESAVLEGRSVRALVGDLHDLEMVPRELKW